MKIHIFGASGSGVTTLGKALAKELAFPYFDSDEYFWEKSDPPFTLRRNREQRNALLKQDMESSCKWILGGSVINWGDAAFTLFDLAIFLWIPAAIRLERLRQRELKRYGDVIVLDPERNKLYTDFMDWASGYDNGYPKGGRTLVAHEDWMRKLSCPVLELREDYSTKERLEMIMKYIDGQTGENKRVEINV